MQLVLARHCETNYNILKLCNSDPSVLVHLTEKGKIQAQDLSKKLANFKFDKIFISELPRALETANYINNYHDMEFTVDSRINDNNTGFEGKSVSEWQSALLNSKNKWTAKFNNGESLSDSYDRVVSFLEDLKKTSFNAVLVVTHGYIVQCVYKYCNNTTFEEADEHQLPQGTYEEYSI
jgi:broad specificity phosphatase PhoE